MSELPRLIIRLTVLLGGRPFSIIYGESEGVSPPDFILTVFHEDGVHWVEAAIDRADLNMPDEDFCARLVDPILCNLDGAAYPKRSERFMKAIKQYASDKLDDIARAG